MKEVKTQGFPKLSWFVAENRAITESLRHGHVFVYAALFYPYLIIEYGKLDLAPRVFCGCLQGVD